MSRKIYHPLSFIAGLIISCQVFSQTASFFSNTEIGIQAHYGSFITAVPKADYVKDSYSYFGEVWFSKPLYANEYENNRSMTRWGAAVFFGHTGSKEYLGKMGGLYPFLDFHLFGINRFESRLRAGLGIGFVEKPYNVETNHKNLLIGSRANLFIEAVWKNCFYVSDRLQFNAGLSFSHLSNATIKLPNLGLNIPAFSVGAGYLINQSTTKETARPDSFDNKLKYNLQLTAGVKQSPWVESNIYKTAILTIEATKQKSLKTRYGAGIALLYDPAVDDQYLDPIISVNEKSYSILNVAPYISYEKIIGRLSVPIQLGMYVLPNPWKRFYQNLGLRYKVNQHWSLGGFLKTHMGRADFVHAGINYSFN